MDPHPDRDDAQPAPEGAGSWPPGLAAADAPAWPPGLAAADAPAWPPGLAAEPAAPSDPAPLGAEAPAGPPAAHGEPEAGKDLDLTGAGAPLPWGGGLDSEEDGLAGAADPFAWGGAGEGAVVEILGDPEPPQPWDEHATSPAARIVGPLDAQPGTEPWPTGDLDAERGTEPWPTGDDEPAARIVSPFDAETAMEPEPTGDEPSTAAGIPASADATRSTASGEAAPGGLRARLSRGPAISLPRPRLPRSSSSDEDAAAAPTLMLLLPVLAIAVVAAAAMMIVRGAQVEEAPAPPPAAQAPPKAPAAKAAGEDAAAAKPAPAARRAAAEGWTRVSVPAAGFSIDVPPGYAHAVNGPLVTFHAGDGRAAYAVNGSTTDPTSPERAARDLLTAYRRDYRLEPGASVRRAGEGVVVTARGRRRGSDARQRIITRVTRREGAPKGLFVVQSFRRVQGKPRAGGTSEAALVARSLQPGS